MTRSPFTFPSPVRALMTDGVETPESRRRAADAAAEAAERNALCKCPSYRSLGGKVTAYIPMTDRGFGSPASPLWVRKFQPPGSRRFNWQTLHTLGSFNHFPLVACEDGPGHFEPHHLPWRWGTYEEMAGGAPDDAAAQRGALLGT